MPNDRFEQTDAVLRDACGRVFTGAVARIERGGDVVFERAYGVTREDDHARPVYVDTRFDLASLTKIFVTTQALRAIESRKLALDEPLTAWFPQWAGTPHAAITLRMLLAHNSGMNSGADFRQLHNENVEQYALYRDLVGEPGGKVIYSDLGFIALGALLQRVYDVSLAALDTCGAVYLPPFVTWKQIPATEDDGWRGRVQGFVHDEKAYLMGGIAGHAGLFGSARDVSRMTEMYLGSLRGRRSSLSRATVEEATREQADDPVLRRGLGWALKTSDENSCGRYFSRSSFGHTGFVGTCIWADPERDVQGVLLTNSVYFGRSDTRDFRAAFYESIPS